MDTADAIRAFEQISQYQPSYLGGVVSGGNIIPVANPAGIHPTTTAGAGTTDLSNLLPNFPGTGRPLYPSPLSMSAFRTMGFDGLFAVSTGGSGMRRQKGTNNGIPSHFWETVRELGCYDVFEPGETVKFTVSPLHPANPAFGNIQSLAALNANYTYDLATGQGANNPLPAGNWPWITSQYDGHEGIDGETLPGDATASATDRVVRRPDWVLTIGYHGYKIIRAPEMLR
jgi:hypothetical protein